MIPLNDVTYLIEQLKNFNSIVLTDNYVKPNIIGVYRNFELLYIIESSEFKKLEEETREIVWNAFYQVQYLLPLVKLNKTNF